MEWEDSPSIVVIFSTQSLSSSFRGTKGRSSSYRKTSGGVKPCLEARVQPFSPQTLSTNASLVVWSPYRIVRYFANMFADNVVARASCHEALFITVLTCRYIFDGRPPPPSVAESIELTSDGAHTSVSVRWMSTAAHKSSPCCRLNVHLVSIFIKRVFVLKPFFKNQLQPFAHATFDHLDSLPALLHRKGCRPCPSFGTTFCDSFFASRHPPLLGCGAVARRHLVEKIQKNHQNSPESRPHRLARCLLLPRLGGAQQPRAPTPRQPHASCGWCEGTRPYWARRPAPSGALAEEPKRMKEMKETRHPPLYTTWLSV